MVMPVMEVQQGTRDQLSLGGGYSATLTSLLRRGQTGIVVVAAGNGVK
jgi:hypothetical protein